MHIGITGDREIVVTKAMLASSAGSGLVDVFATPVMIAEIERTAASSVQPFLEDGCVTVGTQVDVAHLGATAEGKTVRIHTELTAISENGRFLTFKAEVSDAVEVVGTGTHTRAIINTERFMKKLAAKYTAAH